MGLKTLGVIYPLANLAQKDEWSMLSYILSTLPISCNRPAAYITSLAANLP